MRKLLLIGILFVIVLTYLAYRAKEHRTIFMQTMVKEYSFFQALPYENLSSRFASTSLILHNVKAGKITIDELEIDDSSANALTFTWTGAALNVQALLKERLPETIIKDFKGYIPFLNLATKPLISLSLMGEKVVTFDGQLVLPKKEGLMTGQISVRGLFSATWTQKISETTAPNFADAFAGTLLKQASLPTAQYGTLSVSLENQGIAARYLDYTNTLPEALRNSYQKQAKTIVDFLTTGKMDITLQPEQAKAFLENCLN